MRILWLFVTNDDGQDLLEYALLGSTIGFAAVVGVDVISDAMNSAYITWDTAIQSDELVEIPDPVPHP